MKTKILIGVLFCSLMGFANNIAYHKNASQMETRHIVWETRKGEVYSSGSF